MKLALLGYGKMGKEVERIALERGHEVVCRINSMEEWNDEVIKSADVAIEFTRPDSVVANLKACFRVGIPVVTGTTGWYDHFDEIKEACANGNGALFYATNFSIGVNLFFEINKRAAQIMGKAGSYHASMEEIHHTEKKDAPSGTAITLAEGMIEQIPDLARWENQESSATDALGIVSLRLPGVTGTHTIKYTGPVDEITLEHKAYNRSGFASGAVVAAEWILNKHGVYTMKDLLNT